MKKFVVIPMIGLFVMMSTPAVAMHHITGPSKAMIKKCKNTDVNKRSGYCKYIVETY